MKFGVAALRSRPPKVCEVCEVWGRYAPVTAANPLSFWSQIDIPNPLYLFKLERDRGFYMTSLISRQYAVGEITYISGIVYDF